MRRPRSSLALLSFLFLLTHQSSLAVADYEVPRTEWGLPDLQGVWNFSSNVPLQRPEHFGDQQFLSADEIAAAQVQRFSLGAADAPIKSASGAEAFYNDSIWMVCGCSSS